jgi:hypothetical protein
LRTVLSGAQAVWARTKFAWTQPSSRIDTLCHTHNVRDRNPLPMTATKRPVTRPEHKKKPQSQQKSTSHNRAWRDTNRTLLFSVSHCHLVDARTSHSQVITSIPLQVNWTRTTTGSATNARACTSCTVPKPAALFHQPAMAMGRLLSVLTAARAFSGTSSGVADRPAATVERFDLIPFPQRRLQS